MNSETLHSSRWFALVKLLAVTSVIAILPAEANVVSAGDAEGYTLRQLQQDRWRYLEFVPKPEWIKKGNNRFEITLSEKSKQAVKVFEVQLQVKYEKR